MMAAGEHARLATAADLGSIGAIADTIAAEMADHRGGALFLRRESGGDAARRAAALLDTGDATDGSGFVVVGTYDDVPFGYALVQIEELGDGGRLARIDDLAVEAEARGSGIGEAIMNLVLDQAKVRGCFGVDSRALPGDRHTKNFFESFGLKARMLVVHKALD
jgi:GNAT superfamily N-acetyltransferase